MSEKAQASQHRVLAVSLLRDAAFLAGVGLIVAGVWLISVPVAFIVAGVLLIVLAIRGLR